MGVKYMQKWEERVYDHMEGKKEGLLEGIHALIEDNLENGTDKKRIIEKLQKHFSLSEEEAKKALEKF